MAWDPERYLRYADERGRPFVELLARIPAAAPGTVVDLGCGAGNLTALLLRRWPDAQVRGIDSSPEMIDRARRDQPGIGFEVGDLAAWSGTADVLIANASLQWVPGHLELLPHLWTRTQCLAFSVPGNFDEPSHTIRRDLAAEPAYAPHTAGVAVPASHDPSTYLEILTAAGARVDAWETTYLHVLTGTDPVFEWVSGTGARPTLAALPPDLRAEFVKEFKRRLAAAYPPDPEGRVVLPFRRIFVVATRD
ncbi:methyltransferase domain-containing protein [Nocardioides limicola]|uniref:methyltransferase domain-containing protein n=1 Tax=Nocardioides limicola TaxID=2803368 RepID=UPI0027DD6D0A|nr:methyltransferase domain-containing protein [Nocardioides sp. DJM-14]